MDSKQVRRVRCLERINAILVEENCVLQAGFTIIGTRITDSQVFIQPLDDPAPVDNAGNSEEEIKQEVMPSVPISAEAPPEVSEEAKTEAEKESQAN